uniref:Uncharacterized protein n=1 Tax=Tanacetum cinerariifolium TaxID=118510 RepID=A0A699GPA4_TANCI|nr:hypothetical protein [Tanacetum cinerariifolium]
MIHSISPCYVFTPAMSAYSFTIHHLASRLASILHGSCMASYKGDLYKLLLVRVMAAPTILISVEENLRDISPTRVGDMWYSRAIARDDHTEVRGDQGGVADSEREQIRIRQTGSLCALELDHWRSLRHDFMA